MKKFINYCKTCYNELAHEVTWPSWKELFQSSGVVLTASLVIALVVWVMDYAFENIMKLVYSFA